MSLRPQELTETRRGGGGGHKVLQGIPDRDQRLPRRGRKQASTMEEGETLKDHNDPQDLTTIPTNLIRKSCRINP